MTLTLSQRSAHYTPSPIRELLNLTEQPGMISLAGGLPAPESFPVQALRAACVDVLDTQAQGALQYGPSEGIAPLREWVAAHLRAQGIEVGDNQPYDGSVLIGHSLQRHGIDRGLRHLLVELRQDEVATAAGQQAWAGRLAEALPRCGFIPAVG